MAGRLRITQVSKRSVIQQVRVDSSLALIVIGTLFTHEGLARAFLFAIGVTLVSIGVYMIWREILVSEKREKDFLKSYGNEHKCENSNNNFVK